MHERNCRVLTAKAESVSLLSATKLPIKLANDKVKSKLPWSQSCMDRESNAAQSLPEHSWDDHDESGSGDESCLRNRARSNRPHSPGFKKRCSRVKKFSGRTGDCNLNYGLKILKKLPGTVAGMTTNGHRVSHGLLQALPRPLGTEHSAVQRKCALSRRYIKANMVYIYVDPWTAYQRCHELRYDQFNSV